MGYINPLLRLNAAHQLLELPASCGASTTLATSSSRVSGFDCVSEADPAPIILA